MHGIKKSDFANKTEEQKQLEREKVLKGKKIIEKILACKQSKKVLFPSSFFSDDLPPSSSADSSFLSSSSSFSSSLPYELLKASEKILELNPEVLTVWNFRREIILFLTSRKGKQHTNQDETKRKKKETETAEEEKSLREKKEKEEKKEEQEKEEEKEKKKEEKEEREEKEEKQKKEDVECLFNELKLTEYALRKNAKIYSVWFQRLWIINLLVRKKIYKEEDIWREINVFCLKCLQLDERNFHAWNFANALANLLLHFPCENDDEKKKREELIKYIEDKSPRSTEKKQEDAEKEAKETEKKEETEKEEKKEKEEEEKLQDAKEEEERKKEKQSDKINLMLLNFTQKLIERNFSNFSAWHQRKTIPFKHMDYIKELDWLREGLYTEPNDESLWLYYHFLLFNQINPSPPLQLIRAFYEEREKSLIFFFSEIFEMQMENSFCLIPSNQNVMRKLSGSWEAVGHQICEILAGKNTRIRAKRAPLSRTWKFRIIEETGKEEKEENDMKNISHGCIYKTLQEKGLLLKIEINNKQENYINSLLHKNAQSSFKRCDVNRYIMYNIDDYLYDNQSREKDALYTNNVPMNNSNNNSNNISLCYFINLLYPSSSPSIVSCSCNSDNKEICNNNNTLQNNEKCLYNFCPFVFPLRCFLIEENLQAKEKDEFDELERNVNLLKKKRKEKRKEIYEFYLNELTQIDDLLLEENDCKFILQAKCKLIEGIEQLCEEAENEEEENRSDGETKNEEKSKINKLKNEKVELYQTLCRLDARRTQFYLYHLGKIHLHDMSMEYIKRKTEGNTKHTEGETEDMFCSKKIISLPYPSFINLYGKHFLKLSHNSLSNSILKESSLTYMTTLRNIDLSFNCFEDLPNLLFYLSPLQSLITLDVSHNPLKEFSPACITLLPPNLLSIDISGSPLSNDLCKNVTKDCDVSLAGFRVKITEVGAEDDLTNTNKYKVTLSIEKTE